MDDVTTIILRAPVIGAVNSIPQHDIEDCHRTLFNELLPKMSIGLTQGEHDFLMGLLGKHSRE